MDITNSQSQPARRQRSGSQDEGGEVELENKKPGSKGYGHKRTKTGCLTCRKRRIKCGEEKPTCQNCIKSKRQCEGYNQRVVFKEPINVYRGPQGSSHASSSRNTLNARQVETSQRPLPAPVPLPIAPKPFGSKGVASSAAKSSRTTATSTAEQGMYEFSIESFTATPAEPLPHSVSKPVNDADSSGRSSLPTPRPENSPQDNALHSDPITLESVDRSSSSPLGMAPSSTDLLGWPDGPPSASLNFSDEIFYDSNSRYPATTTPLQFYPSSSDWPHAPESSTSFSTPFAAQGAYSSAFPARGPAPTAAPTSQAHYQHIQPWDREQRPRYHDPSPEMPENPEPVSAPWRTDVDDPFDVSDDDTNMDDGIIYKQDLPGDSCTTDNELGVIAFLQAGQGNQDLSLRSITSFIDRPNMLQTYVPSHGSSPLNNSMTARIFAHFINVTAPTMSMFERHPSNPSLIFSGTHVPKSQQNVWSYSLPSLSFHHDGLLHAMLAMASLHIAKLQNDHITASLKHYSISLRRIGSIVSNPERRAQPATLAASLLLAFYECWGADHQKWSNHLLGAKMLIKEIDFAGMTKYLKSMKLKHREVEESQNFPGMHQTFGGIDGDSNLYQRLNEDVDENIVGMLMGKRVQYDQYGHIIDDDADDMGRKSYTQKQLEDYEIQRDLFWWYLKMDSYHSILGGGRLYMEYDRWSHCPPRAPLGRLNATCGTYDHLILLLGRVGDFAAKDLKRKKLAWKANAQRRPPQGTSMPSQAGQHGPPQPPPFAGMIPETGEARLPMGFERSFGSLTPEATRVDYTDLEAQRIEAEEEWNDIMNAFSILEDHFGEDFQALGPEFSRPIQTPFGTALQYRTYAIAGIWMNYYMALIVCHRAHPSMPPAAMMAAGMAARHTASFANEVGRIAAGIAPNCDTASEVTPGVGAALIEVSFCIFISGVQYQDATQRAWTVNRLRSVTRLTGWASSTAAISGCESSWKKQAELGRGPPYTRTEGRLIPLTSEDEGRQTRRIDLAMQQVNAVGEKFKVQETDRAHYAMGLLGVEEDFEKLALENDGDGK